MERVFGREAVGIYAEVKIGKREVNDEELRYLKFQVTNFTQWLAKKAEITPMEAVERVKNMIEADIKLITADDPYAEFIWSRGDEVGEIEINGLGAMAEDFDLVSDQACLSDSAYWARMEHIADRNVGKYPDEVWKASQEKMEQVLEYLNGYKTKLPNGKTKMELKKANKRIWELRFGKQPVLLMRHWKLCQNLMNELLGNPKRYIIKEPVEKTEEEKIDAMDNNPVYGYDFSRI